MIQATPLLEVRNLVVRFGGFCALNGVDLLVGEGERVGLIGPNGSGKSTLTHCIGGALTPSAGTVVWNGRDITGVQPHTRAHLGIARSFQIPRPFRSMSTLENVELALAFRRPALSPKEASGEAQRVLAMVGLEEHGSVGSAALTQVELRKLELARAVAVSPKLLVADEAMAGLSGSEMEEILALLMSMQARGIAVLMIEHIMQAVNRFSDRIVVLVAGKKIADGRPSDVLGARDVIAAYLGE